MAHKGFITRRNLISCVLVVAVHSGTTSLVLAILRHATTILAPTLAGHAFYHIWFQLAVADLLARLENLFTALENKDLICFLTNLVLVHGDLVVR